MDGDRLAGHVREIFGNELARIRDETLRQKVVRTWVRSMELSGATDLIQDLPSIGPLRENDQPGFGVEHVRAVVQLALALAETLPGQHRTAVNTDIVAAGALLHDVGKLFDNAPAERHELCGPLVGHSFSGLHLAVEEGLPREVLHIIAYHTFEERRHRRTLECEIVHRADFLSVDALTRRETGKTRADFG